MSEFVLFVVLDTVPGQRDAFLARVREHRANIQKNEPDCQRFDISLPEDNDNQVRLYEIYTDQAAFDRHVASEHMKEFRADTAPMVAGRELIRGALANE